MGLTEEDVIERIVSKSTRYGARIQLQQVASVPQDTLEAQLLPHIEQQIANENAARGGKRTRKLIGLEAKARVLEISGGLRRHIRRNPTVYQVLAVPAIQYGLESQQLDDISRVMGTTQTHYPGEVTWDGATAYIRQAIRVDANSRIPHVRINVPARIEELLHNSPDTALDTGEVARGIGLPETRGYFNHINSSFQLLETAGFIRKQPLHSVPGVAGGGFAVVSHRAYDNPFPRHPNSRLDILEALFQWSDQQCQGNPGSIRISVMFRPFTTKGKVKGSPNATYSVQVVRSSAHFLEDAGLVDCTPEQLGRLDGSRGSVPVTVLSLTPQAERYLTEMHRKQILPEGLRKLLLGERT